MRDDLISDEGTTVLMSAEDWRELIAGAAEGVRVGVVFLLGTAFGVAITLLGG